MHDTAESFRLEAENKYGTDLVIEEFPEGTKTARDAADAIDCSLGQIVKSIAVSTGENIVIVLTSGVNEVDLDNLAKFLRVSDAETADPQEVKEKTGWSIGGVPPFCHKNETKILMDPKLNEYEEIWAAAGTPKAVFKITPRELKNLANPEIADVFR